MKRKTTRQSLFVYVIVKPSASQLLLHLVLHSTFILISLYLLIFKEQKDKHPHNQITFLVEMACSHSLLNRNWRNTSVAEDKERQRLVH